MLTNIGAYSDSIQRFEDQLEAAVHLSEEERTTLIARQTSKESEFERSKRIRLTSEDFRTIKVIGRGAFGIVKIVEKLDNGRIYAMKTMRKSEMIKHNQVYNGYSSL